jgi:hypothetical protein
MGSRTNFQLKDFHGSIWLYSHSGGDFKSSDLAMALIKAEPRWSDTAYGIRIVISQLIGERWPYETGFGISTKQVSEENYEPMLIDFTTMQVTVTSADNYETQTVYTFLEFIEKYRTA